MAAGDLLVEVGDPGTATTLSANYTPADTSVTVASTSNWPSTGKAVVFAIDSATVVDGKEVQTSGTYCEFEGTVASATSITNVDYKRGSGDQNFAAGALTRVYIPVSSERENRIVTWGGVEHSTADGTHTDITATTISLTGDIDLADTKGIRDGNNNEVVKIGQTASAVNEITLTNAATGGDVDLSATGDDTDIGITVTPKGTGLFKTPFIGCRVYLSTEQSIASSSATKINFDTESYDIGSNWDTSNYRFTAPVTGYYRVHYNATILNLALNSYMQGYVYVNGSPVTQIKDISSNANADPSVNHSDVVFANSGEYIEAYVWHDHGSNRDAWANAKGSYFTIEFVGV